MAPASSSARSGRRSPAGDRADPRHRRGRVAGPPGGARTGAPSRREPVACSRCAARSRAARAATARQRSSCRAAPSGRNGRTGCSAKPWPRTGRRRPRAPRRPPRGGCASRCGRGRWCAAAGSCFGSACGAPASTARSYGIRACQWHLTRAYRGSGAAARRVAPESRIQRLRCHSAEPSPQRCRRCGPRRGRDPRRARAAAKIAGCPLLPRTFPTDKRVDRLPVAAGSDAIVAWIGLDEGAARRLRLRALRGRADRDPLRRGLEAHRPRARALRLRRRVRRGPLPDPARRPHRGRPAPTATARAAGRPRRLPPL